MKIRTTATNNVTNQQNLTKKKTKRFSTSFSSGGSVLTSKVLSLGEKKTTRCGGAAVLLVWVICVCVFCCEVI